MALGDYLKGIKACYSKAILVPLDFIQKRNFLYKYMINLFFLSEADFQNSWF